MKKTAQEALGWFPYDRYNHWKKHSAIIAIIWKPTFSNRCEML